MKATTSSLSMRLVRTSLAYVWAVAVALFFVTIITTSSKFVVVVTAYTPPLEIYAFKFFDSTTGESVALKGIDYYPRPNDGDLNDNNIDFYHDEYTHIWRRDIPILQELGVNAIRIYGVDPGKNHDTFMCALQEAGIYVMVSLSADCEDCAISAVQSPGCYPPQLKARGQYIINIFAKYDNVLAFSAGNEVGLAVEDPTWNAPCEKKFIHDMRTYIKGCADQLGMRQIPVGAIIADVDRVDNTNYYNCQTTDDDLERAEWMGLNAYQHCDGTVTDSDNAVGYQNLKVDFADFSIPLMLTEYGCLNDSFEDVNNFQAQRTFLDAKWIFEPDFRDIFAGGFVFEYSVERQNALVPFPFQEFGPGNFGIGYLAGELCTDNPDNEDDWCRYLKKPEFTNLQQMYAATTHIGVENRDSFQPASTRQGAATCPDGWPALTDYTWESDAEANLWCTDAVTFQCVNIQSPDTDTNSTKSTASPTTAPDSGNATNDGPTAAPAAPDQPSSDVPSSVPTVTPRPTITARPTGPALPPTTLPTSVNLGNATGGSESIRLKNFRVTLSGDEPDEVALKNTMLTYLSDDFTKAFKGFLFMRLDVLRTSRTRRANAVATVRDEQLLEIGNSSDQRRLQQHDHRDLQVLLFEVDFFGTATFTDDANVPSIDQVEQQQTISLSNRTAIETAMEKNPAISDDIVLERVEYIEAQTSRAPTPTPPPLTSSAVMATRAAMTGLLSLLASSSLILFNL